MCDQKLCSAPNGKNRCVNLALQGKLHCSDHIKQALTLYNQYKSVCDELENYSIDKIFSPERKSILQKIQYLHKYYCLLMRVYNGRKKHKQTCFVPDLEDPGHEKQFEIIDETVFQIIDKLIQLYAQHLKAQEEKIPSDQKESKQIEDVIDTVKKYHKKRINDAKLTEGLLNKYIKENMKIKEDHSRLIDSCITLMRQLSGITEDDNTCYDYAKLFCFYHLLRSLAKMGYLTGEFKPQKCDCPKSCGKYAFYTVKIVCGCISHHDTIDEFFENMQDEYLKEFYQVMQSNTKKIENIAVDYMDLWEEYDYDIMNIDVSCMWDPAYNRLKLRTDDTLMQRGRRVQPMKANGNEKRRYRENKKPHQCPLTEGK